MPTFFTDSLPNQGYVKLSGGEAEEATAACGAGKSKPKALSKQAAARKTCCLKQLFSLSHQLSKLQKQGTLSSEAKSGEVKATVLAAYTELARDFDLPPLEAAKTSQRIEENTRKRAGRRLTPDVLTTFAEMNTFAPGVTGILSRKAADAKTDAVARAASA